jgi:hypothetical protein
LHALGGGEGVTERAEFGDDGGGGRAAGVELGEDGGEEGL